MPDEREKFSVDEMVSEFTLDRVSSSPIFDTTKLDWLNGTWIREELNDDEFASRVSQWALNREHLMPLIPLVRPLQKWSDLADILHFS